MTRGGLKIVNVYANQMLPSAANASVPGGGSTSFHGSAYHLQANTVQKGRLWRSGLRTFNPRKDMQGDPAQRPKHSIYFSVIRYLSARNCFKFWG